MEIYLLRHGIADEARPGGKDSDRALTAEGRKRLKIILKRAQACGVSPAVVLTSPYKRALQTAEIAMKELDVAGEPLRANSLRPSSTPEEAWNEIRLHLDARRLLIAGHEPLLSQLAAHLLDAPSLRVDFKKGALIRIDLDHMGATPRGVLRWMMTPSTAS